MKVKKWLKIIELKLSRVAKKRLNKQVKKFIINIQIKIKLKKDKKKCNQSRRHHCTTCLFLKMTDLFNQVYFIKREIVT